MRNPFEQLRHIEEAISKIMQYTKEGRDTFDKEEKIQFSIIHYLHIIDQVGLAIPQDFKASYPEIPWEKVAHLYHYLASLSDYTEMNRDTLWAIVEHDLPLLKSTIDEVLARDGETTNYNKRLSSPAREKYTALQELLQANRENILRTASKYGASNIRVFGSVAREEADAKSDIDLLVDMEQGRTLFDLSGLLTDLHTLLGCEVDVMTERGLHSRIRERVLKEAIPL